MYLRSQEPPSPPFELVLLPLLLGANKVRCCCRRRVTGVESGLGGATGAAAADTVEYGPGRVDVG